MPSQKVLSRKHSNHVRKVGNGVSSVEGITLKGTVLKMLSNENVYLYCKISLSLVTHPVYYVVEYKLEH